MNGRFEPKYRHEMSGLLMQSYSEVCTLLLRQFLIGTRLRKYLILCAGFVMGKDSGVSAFVSYQPHNTVQNACKGKHYARFRYLFSCLIDSFCYLHIKNKNYVLQNRLRDASARIYDRIPIKRFVSDQTMFMLS